MRCLIANRPAGLLRDRDVEGGAGCGERAADRERLVMQPLRVPFLDVEVEASGLATSGVNGTSLEI
jgi:hypothetical protein